MITKKFEPSSPLTSRHWSEDELLTARAHLETQRRLLEDTNPRNRRKRKKVEKRIRSLEWAIEKYGG